MRVLLGDRTGRVRAELDEGTISNVVWRVNSMGSAVLRMVRGSAAFKKELLEPGSRVYVEFDNGLPTWGGALDLPRVWRSGEVEMTVYTIERLLRYQLTQKTRPFYRSVVGSIFTQVLMEADQNADIGLTLGQIWHGGSSHDPRYHFRDVMWVLDESIRKLENCDYRFVPYISGDRIMFRAELHQMLGDDKRERVAFAEGQNAAEVSLAEQGDIVNRIPVVGTGATWGERDVVWGVEEESRRQYGLRERALVPSDASAVSTLYRYADRAIREDAYPHVIASMSVTDIAPASFADYDIGDIVRVILPSFGFSGYDDPMRVMARGFDPASGKCEIVCEGEWEYSPIIQSEDATRPEGEE